MHTLHKLLFAKHCTCYCVCLSIWPTKFKITLSFLCKTYFVFENFKGDCLKILNLGKSGLKLVLWKSISSHTHAFYFLYSMLWGVFSKNQVIFSEMLFFQIFDWSNLFFDQSKFLLKFWASICFDQSKLIFDQSKLIFDQS